jgi:hypothetical protein
MAPQKACEMGRRMEHLKGLKMEMLTVANLGFQMVSLMGTQTVTE